LTFLFNNMALMFAPLAAYPMGQLGLWWGVCWLCFSTVATWVSGVLIGDLCERTGAQTYPEIGLACAGRAGQRLVAAVQWAGYYLNGVVQIAYSGAYWNQAFDGVSPRGDRNPPPLPCAAERPAIDSLWWQSGLFTSMCQSDWMMVTAALVLLAVQVPSFRHLGRASWIGAVTGTALTALYLYVTIHRGAYVGGRASGHAIPCYGQWTARSMLTAVPSLAYLYAGHGAFPEQRREMTTPDDFVPGRRLERRTPLPPTGLIAARRP
jgi:hypothetical protein